MNEPLVIRRQVHLPQVDRQTRGRAKDPSPMAGRVPRVTRLVALAIHIDELVQRGDVAGYAQLARQLRVSRARIAQIVKLRYLAPDLQQTILFLPGVQHGADPITERDLRPIAAQPEWRKQRLMWATLVDRRCSLATSK